MLPVVGVLMTGCTATSDNSGFSSGGNYNVNDYLSETDTGLSDSEEESELPEGTPVIESFSATFDDDYPGYDFVFALEVTYTDSDENVDGGYLRCAIEVDGGNTSSCISEMPEGLPIDGLNPFTDGGVVYLYLDPGTYDEDQAFYFEVALVDTDGNESATAGASIQ
jgi:hypothetical protein